MASEIAGRRGRYVVERELGSGGVGVVYAGREKGSNRRVAIKVLRDPAADPDTRRRFEQEAALGASFEHPNVVRVLDTGVHDGCPFLVMDLVEGETLEALLRRGELGREEALRIVARLARALDAAHRHGIVHRDVKPANVIVTALGAPVLTDFGFAKDLKAGAQLTGEFVVGTPTFMAPEQVQVGPITPAVDVHALGVLLYVIVARELPFDGADFQEIFQKIAFEEPTPPRRHAPEVAPELEAVILRCLRKEPLRRYASAAELAKALEALLEKGAFTAAPGDPHLARVLFAGGFLGVVAAGVLAIFLMRSRSAPPPPPSAPPPPPPRAPAPPAPRPPRGPRPDELLLGANAALDAFRTREAIARLESALHLYPDSVDLRVGLDHANAVAGRDQQTAAEEPPAGFVNVGEPWQPLKGGAWFEKDGLILGRGHGSGPYDLAALVQPEAAPGERYRVSVEVQLGTGYPGPYAGLIFGAQSLGDYFAAYVFKEDGHAMVRLARIVNDQWDMRGQTPVSFEDGRFVELVVESTGGGVVAVVVDGKRNETKLERRLDGRVGILKYYDTVARFRRFSCRALE